MKKNILKVALIALSTIVLSCQSKPAEAPPQASADTNVSWSGSMNRLKLHLEHLAPYIFDSKKFESSENREFLNRKIKEMAVASQNLNHNPTLTHRDPTVRFVASQFSQSLFRANAAMYGGQATFARYELMKVTSSCVQCHARMQQGPEFNSVFFQSPFLKELPPLDQAEYLVATRQFDRASKVLLQSLNSKDPELAEQGQYEKLAYLGLQLSVQYEQNPKLALQMIQQIQKSPLANQFLKQKAGVWRQAAEAWNRPPVTTLTMSEAKKILQSPVNELQVMRAIPLGLSRLSEEISGPELGESLQMMGKAYEFLSEIQTFELHENYYESCIRSVPHSKIAKKCFENLKSSIVAGYTGTSGTHLPVEIQIWLDQMRKEAE